MKPKRTSGGRVKVQNLRTGRWHEVEDTVDHANVHCLICREPNLIAMEIVPAGLIERQAPFQDCIRPLIVNGERFQFSFQLNSIRGLPHERSLVNHEGRGLTSLAEFGAQERDGSNRLYRSHVVDREVKREVAEIVVEEYPISDDPTDGLKQ